MNWYCKPAVGEILGFGWGYSIVGVLAESVPSIVDTENCISSEKRCYDVLVITIFVIYLGTSLVIIVFALLNTGTIKKLKKNMITQLSFVCDEISLMAVRR